MPKYEIKAIKTFEAINAENKEDAIRIIRDSMNKISPNIIYSEEEGRQWIKDNIDPKYLETEELESHYKYLKTEKTIQVPIQLLCDIRSKIGSLTNEYPYADLNRIITEYEESLK